MSSRKRQTKKPRNPKLRKIIRPYQHGPGLTAHERRLLTRARKRNYDPQVIIHDTKRIKILFTTTSFTDKKRSS